MSRHKPPQIVFKTGALKSLASLANASRWQGANDCTPIPLFSPSSCGPPFAPALAVVAGTAQRSEIRVVVAAASVLRDHVVDLRRLLAAARAEVHVALQDALASDSPRVAVATLTSVGPILGPAPARAMDGTRDSIRTWPSRTGEHGPPRQFSGPRSVWPGEDGVRSVRAAIASMTHRGVQGSPF